MKSFDVALVPARRLFRRGFDPDAFAFADFALTFLALDPLGFALELASDLGKDFAFDLTAAFAEVLAFAFAFAFAFKVPASFRCFFWEPPTPQQHQLSFSELPGLQVEYGLTLE